MTDKTVIEKVKLATLAMQRYNWEQGTVAQAFYEYSDRQTSILMAREAAYRQDDLGRCAQIGNTTSSTDPCSIGEVLIDACDATNDSLMKDALGKLLKWALYDAPRNEKGIVYHLQDKAQFWVDSFYMLPPFLARAGYIDEAIKQINGYWSALFNADMGLLSHIWDDGQGEFVRKALWGVGNGWAMAGLARVIALLPNDRAVQRNELIVKAKTLIDASLKYQREDGLFHDVLDDKSTFVETNFAQMLAYTVFRAVKAGWLAVSYTDVALRIRDAVYKKVDSYGLVEDVCGAPSFDKPGVAPEGQAFFILMEAAYNDGGF